MIDKGIPTAGLLAHVLVAKHADHLPLYRQEAIFARAGLAIPRSTLGAWIGQCGVRLQPVVEALKEHLLRCQVLHADETPVAMLDPGSGKTHRACLWAYAAAQSEQLKAVVYDFTRTRAGENARVFLGHSGPDQPQPRRPWTGSLVCDDYSGDVAAEDMCSAACLVRSHRLGMRHPSEHKFRQTTTYNCRRKSISAGVWRRRGGVGRPVMSTQASALAFISRSTSA